MDTIFKKIQKADVLRDPFPHLLFREAIPDDICTELIQNFPSVDTLSRGHHLESNRRFSLPASEALGNPGVTDIWEEFIKKNTSQEYLQQALALFRDHILEQYPDFEKTYGPIEKLRAGVRGIDTFDTADILIDAQPSINTPTLRPSSVRGPHLDNPNKLFFGLLYMRHPEDKSEGGELIFYKHKDTETKNIYSYKNNADLSHLEEVKRVPYERNTLFITLGVPDAVHGVSPRGPAKMPRYFVNILAEINGELFSVPYESTSRKLQRKARSVATIEEERGQDYKTVADHGFFQEGRKSILILNPRQAEAAIPEIYEHYNILYLEDIRGGKIHENTNVVGIITGDGGVPLDKEILDSLPNLKVVGLTTGSTKKYITEAVRNKHLPVIDVSETYATAVAELTLMHMISGLRNTFRSYERMRNDHWNTFDTPASRTQKRIHKMRNISIRFFGKSSVARAIQALATLLLNGVKGIVTQYSTDTDMWIRGEWNEKRNAYNSGRRTLNGCSVGIVGYGKVSRKLIKLLQPFNCAISIYSDYLTEEEAARLGIQKVSLPQACTADVVSIHRGLSEKTKGSFGAREIAHIKRGAVLVNTSRGAIINETALIKRLQKGDITACLDVFAQEPLPTPHPFRKLPNVFLTSHIGNMTDETYRRAVANLGKDLVSYVEKARKT